MFAALEDGGKIRLIMVLNYGVGTTGLRKFEVSAWVVRKGAPKRNQNQKDEHNRSRSPCSARDADHSKPRQLNVFD